MLDIWFMCFGFHQLFIFQPRMFLPSSAFRENIIVFQSRVGVVMWPANPRWELILRKTCVNWLRCDAEVPGDCVGGWAPGVLQAGKKGRTPSESPSLHPSSTDNHHHHHHGQGAAQRGGPPPTPGDLRPPPAWRDQSSRQRAPHYRYRCWTHFDAAMANLAITKLWGNNMKHCNIFKVKFPFLFALKSEVPCYWTAWWTTFWKQIPPRQCISSPPSENHTIRWENVFS